MKTAFFSSLAVLVFSLSTLAAPAPPQTAGYELMKCFGPKQGTLWASFGHLIRSGEDQVTYFPTEIIWIASATATPQRMIYPNLEDALKVKISAGPGRLSMEFTAPGPHGDDQQHLIRLVQYPGVPHSFMGSWQTQSTLGEVIGDIACSLH